MELLFLGTGSGVPAKERNTQSMALKMLNERNEVWLFDCGEATQHQILKTSLKPRKISKIFITHMHGDHIYGLAGFLSSRSFQGGDESLTIYGPKGIKNFVMTNLKLSQTHLSYFIHFIELDQESGQLFEDEQLLVSYALLDHGIPCYGFRIEEKSKPGTLLVDKLREDQVPSGPIYGRLKKGESVQLDDGRIIHGKDYIGEPIEGCIVTILSDTKPCPSREKLADQADLLVHESTFSAKEADLAKAYNHSTSLDAARLAEKVNAKKLLLTHISSRYVGRLAKQLEEEARTVFPNTQVVHDFFEIEIN
ncbi:MAG: ribonuclease Z [Tissierellia bacterium]|nr:ribonuclease Z [Tissierellia bacterium]